MSILGLTFPTQINRILTSMKIKVFSFTEFMETDFYQDYHQEAIGCKNGFFDSGLNVISISDNIEDPVEIVLHELVHATGTKERLNRKFVSECQEVLSSGNNEEFHPKDKDIHTEEATAQLGMFKLAIYLGLDPLHYGKSTLAYLQKFPKANLRKAERDSDKAVDYLVSFLELDKVA